MKINLGARVVYFNLLGPSSGIVTRWSEEERAVQCNTYYYDSSLQMNQTQICEVLTSGQVMRLDDFQPHKAYLILRAQEIYMYWSEARILLLIWDYVFRDGYVILPFCVPTRDDINRINNYTLRKKLVYRGVDSSNNPVVDFI